MYATYAVLMIAPAVIGLVLAMLLTRLWPRVVPDLPARARVWVVIGLAIAVTVAVAVLGSGNWPFQMVTLPGPLVWLSTIPGEWQFTAPLVGGIVAAGLQCIPAMPRPRRTVADLARRTPATFAPRGWLAFAIVIAVSAVALAVVGGAASQPGEDGAYSMWMQDAGVGTVGRLIYGWAFSGPSLLLIAVLAATTVLGLALIARPPVAEESAGDLEIRRFRSRTILMTASGAGLIHLGAVLIFFAYTAALNTGIPLDDALVPVFPPFAFLAPALLILGVCAITTGFVFWFQVLIEQLAATRTRTASHAH